MATKVSDIEKKKQELENQLVRIQEGIDRSIDDVKDEVVESLDPKEIIRKYPLHVVGGALVVGFLLARPKGKNRYSSSSGSSLIASEIKKAITKKGLSLLTDFIDGKINSREK
ncbi:hypothetical protein [Balneola vulgaris]|jgi:hypothetical protein|uniref:hypothetical protein n=1 Tax=Balneola vulgaris TaxID=287535 RepID=UPI00036D5852|nr:hypothetical protein [Balneola vulgaris]